MICSGSLCHTTVPVVHDMAQVRAIYIFCGNKAHHEEWATQWLKIKGVFTDITPICDALKQAAEECDQNSVSLSFVAPSSEAAATQNLDQLDSTFMYTQILKEILFTIVFEPKHFVEYITYCREQFVGNTIELKNVDKLEREYRDQVPIWWYTYHCFFYSMLNRALRTMEIDLIVKMGFFIRDLHEQIARLHSEQYDEHDYTTSFTVFRGQGLSQTDFDQLQKTQGGLLSFNNFLSTSTKRQVSLSFARQTIISSKDLMGVLFVITTDPSIPSTPFANIRDVSYYKGEEEILFSMHSIFRIGHVKQIDNKPRLWQVDLTLTGDNDPQLHSVTEYMRKQTKGITGWHRLGKLMIKVGQFNKAEELYQVLLDQTTDLDEKMHLYQMSGVVKHNQGKYTEAIAFYRKSLEICEKMLPVGHLCFAIPYNNIGSTHENMGEYSKALSYYEKSLEIFQKTLPANHPDLATAYNNIGSMCSKMGEYLKAVSYYEKSLEIDQKTLPANHPDLATSYNDIGSMYYRMGEYSKVLFYYEKALEIYQKTLPTNHPDLAGSYNNIGSMCFKMGEYSKALSYYEKALEIKQKTPPANHLSLATTYNSIGNVYNQMCEYSKALSYFEKTLEIFQTISANHPDLATSYNNIGMVYDNMGEYSQALSSHEKALEIKRKALPANHPDLGDSYNNIGSVYLKMGEYSTALSYFEKDLEIGEKSLPANHPDLGCSYNNIGGLYENMGDYSKALFFYERAVDIGQHSLPANHPNLLTTREAIERVKKNL